MISTMSRRRRLAMPLAALTAAVALAGCGSSSDDSTKPAKDDSTPTTSAPASGLLPAAEDKTAYPLTLESPWGETVLEDRPERIATVGYINDLDNTLALGVTPVWADTYAAEYPWTQDAGAAKVEKLGELGETFPFEDIAASQPDLIIAIQTEPGQLKDSYEKLSSIAPVLVAEEPGFDVTWEETVRLIGEATDLSDHAEDVIAGVEDTVAAAAAENPEFAGRSLSLLQWVFGGNPGLSFRTFDGAPASSIFTGLGFEPSPAAAKFDRDNLLLSPENYGEVDADLLLIATPKKEFDKLLKVPTFANVPAVADGRYAFIDLDVETNLGWATSWPSALNVPWVIERITQPLAQVPK